MPKFRTRSFLFFFKGLTLSQNNNNNNIEDNNNNNNNNNTTEAHTKTRLLSLPIEIITHILTLVECEDLCSFERVCKYVKSISTSEHVWRYVYHRLWNKKYLLPNRKGKGKAKDNNQQDNCVGMSMGWKEEFKHRRRCETAWKNHHYLVADLKGHSDDVICLQYNKNLLATGSGDGTVKLWDLKKRKCKASLKHRVDVFCLQMEGNLLASGGGERRITLWDIQQQEATVKLPVKETVKCLQMMGSTLICGSADGFVHIYDLRTNMLQQSFWATAEDVWCLQCEGSRVVCGGVHPTQPLHMWDIRTNSKIRNFMGHNSLVSSLQFEGNILASGSADATVKTWDMNTGACLHTLQNETKVFCVYVNDQWLISGCDNAAAVLWDINSGEKITQFGGPDGHLDAILCLQFDPQRMVTGSYDKNIKVWDVIE